ncbi:hypothetical protein AC1031_011170 [Aphanomyces cochlioides]|nr:hypothetical protein AC1031_011170 [Aphanomyces cochlioides]
MSKIVSICKTLTVATNSSMCSDSESFDMGPLPLACANSIATTTIPKVLDIIFTPNLTAIDGICTHDCLKALISRINTTLPNCQVEWPYLARAPVSPKMLYKTYLNAVYGYDICFGYIYWYGSWSELCAWNATSNNFSLCSAQLASLYSVPFSSTCYQAYKNTFGNQTILLGRMNIIETVLTGLDFVKSRFLAARINCPSSISVGFKTLRTIWSTNYTPTPGLNKCNQSTLATLLSAPLPYACYSNGFSSWTQVFLPYNLSSLSSIPRACAIAALAYTDTFPACEWIDEDVGETLVGINISTRVSSFLVAAQNLPRPSLTISLPTSSPLLYYYPTPAPTNYYPSSSPSTLPSCYWATNSESALFKNYQSVNLSSVCLAFGPWDQGTRAIDFIWRYPDYIPLACFQPACRADIEASAANFGSLSCAESLEMTLELSGLLSLCQRLSLALDEPLCDDWPNLGSIPSECVGVATSGSTTFLELIRSDNLAAMDRITCYSMSCTATISDSINSLPDCKMELQLAGGAPISPKMLYSSTFTAFCNSSALAKVDYNSCSSQLAALYTIPFSKTCNMVLSSIPMKLYVLQTAFTGDYIHQAQKIAATPACMQDVAVMRERLANVSSCAPDLVFASNELQKVLTTTYISDRNLPLCSESQISSGISLLKTSAAASCTFNSKRPTWTNILLPDHLSDLAKFVNNTDCVDAALAIAKSLPNCEWASVTNGDIITGVNVATRTSSFLLAAQSVNETTSTSLAVRRGLTSSLSIAVLATLVLRWL